MDENIDVLPLKMKSIWKYLRIVIFDFQHFKKMKFENFVEFEHALRGGGGGGRSDGGAGKERRAFNYVSPVAPHRLICQIYANQREAVTIANVNKHSTTLAKGYDVKQLPSPPILFPPRRQSASESLLKERRKDGTSTPRSPCQHSLSFFCSILASKRKTLHDPE